MANSLIVAYDGSSNITGFTSTAQSFWAWSTGCLVNGQQIANAGGPSTEASQQVYFAAGILTQLSCRVTTSASSSSTVVLRNNSGNANNTFSITSNGTGIFSDATHNDSIAAGDLVDIAITAGATSLVITSIWATFSASTNTKSVVGGFNGVFLINVGSAKTWYLTSVGAGAYGVAPLTVEAAAKNRQRKSMTINNLAIQVDANGSGSSTFTSRKNGVNGTLTISVSSNSTGLFKDTAHSDSVVSGDDYNFTYTDGTSSGNFFYPIIFSAHYSSTTQDSIYTCANDQGTSFSTSNTRYAGLAGGLETVQSTETNAQVLVNNAYTFSQLTVNVTADTISLNSTVNLRANAGNTGVTVSITANTNGIFVDNVNTYTASSTDEMNYQVVTGSTGTSLKIEQISVWGNITPGAAAGGPSYQHFDNSTQVNRQNLNAFGGQLTIFG